MNVAFDFPIKFDERTVYVRPVFVSELPIEVQAEMAQDLRLYAIHAENGERLALTKDRNVAFALARTNEFTPVSVH